MNNRNTKSATRTGTLNVNNKTYVLARTDVFYYLKFIDYSKELFKAASNLTSKPTIVFYTENNTDKIIIDYSLANQSDKSYLTSFFANLPPNEGFTLIHGSYLDKNELTANISCGITYERFVDYKIFGDVVSVTDRNDALDVYSGDYFTGVPQIIKTGSLGTNPSTVNYALVSVAPTTNKPLSYMSPKVGDIFAVSNTNSANNGLKFEITEITTLNNQEIFKLKPVFGGDLPDTESLVGEASVLDLYIPSSANIEQISQLDKTIIGCCNSLTDFSVTDNNTQYQCALRNTNSYIFNPGTCAAQTSPTNTVTRIIPRPIVNSYDTAQDVLSSDTVINSTIKTLIGASTTALLNLYVYTGDPYAIAGNKITLNTLTKYCFSQPDPSNYGFILRFSTSKDTYTPYTAGIYGGVKSTGLNSNQFMDTKLFNYPTLYIFLEKTINLDVTDKTPVFIKTDYYISV